MCVCVCVCVCVFVCVRERVLGTLSRAIYRPAVLGITALHATYTTVQSAPAAAPAKAIAAPWSSASEPAQASSRSGMESPGRGPRTAIPAVVATRLPHAMAGPMRARRPWSPAMVALGRASTNSGCGGVTGRGRRRASVGNHVEKGRRGGRRGARCPVRVRALCAAPGAPVPVPAALLLRVRRTGGLARCVCTRGREGRGGGEAVRGSHAHCGAAHREPAISSPAPDAGRVCRLRLTAR